MTRRPPYRKGVSRTPYLAEVLAHQVADLTDDWACAKALADAGFESSLIWRRLDEAQVMARDLRSEIADALTLPLEETA